MDTFYVLGTSLSTFYMLTHLIFLTMLWGKYYYLPCAINEKIDEQKYYKTCPRLSSLQVEPRQMTLEP